MKRLLVVLCVLPTLANARAAEPGPTAHCAAVRNDDTIRPYDPALRAGLLRAYRRLFPQARMPPEDWTFRAETHVRCMDSRLLACFTGANLPCSRMNTARDNHGATEFCRFNPQAQVVPAFAVGHDSAYAYRCVNGRPEVTGDTFKPDARGFANALWAPLD